MILADEAPHRTVRIQTPNQSIAGTGGFELSQAAGATTVTRLWSNSPLRILAPRPRGQSAWLYAASLGGGLVSGDRLSMSIRAGPDTTGMISTQSSTKVFKRRVEPVAAAAGCIQKCKATLASGSLLTVMPEPVTCFADASFEQDQRFDLAGDASLVLVDWLTSGRMARGERWAFQKYRSRIDIYRDGELLIRDSTLLTSDDGELSSPRRLGRFDCLATAILIGPRVASMTARILETVGAEPVTARSPLLVAASPIGPNGSTGVLLRIAGISTHLVAARLRELLAGLVDVLGDDPWQRKW